MTFLQPFTAVFSIIFTTFHDFRHSLLLVTILVQLSLFTLTADGVLKAKPFDIYRPPVRHLAPLQTFFAHKDVDELHGRDRSLQFSGGGNRRKSTTKKPKTRSFHVLNGTLLKGDNSVCGAFTTKEDCCSLCKTLECPECSCTPGFCNCESCLILS